ncbi:hypothetical protein BST95_06675 [Halioglobus japonicus]|nr:hypothetical protein BST95_06675 [Halioglobus japonicus]
MILAALILHMTSFVWMYEIYTKYWREAVGESAGIGEGASLHFYAPKWLMIGYIAILLGSISFVIPFNAQAYGSTVLRASYISVTSWLLLTILYVQLFA